MTYSPIFLISSIGMFHVKHSIFIPLEYYKGTMWLRNWQGQTIGMTPIEKRTYSSL